MKKIFFYLLTVTFSVTSIFLQKVEAQNVAPYWSLAGNSNAGAGSKLGTTNGVPLRLFTNNAERIRIDAAGQVGIGIPTPVSILTIRSSGGTPVASWLNAISSPIITGFSEGINGELNINTASSDAAARRAVFQGKRSRGALAAPAAVLNNDYLLSFVASGYDGGAFQNPATIDFYVDGAPSAGNVPGRISFVTGSNTGNRVERLKVGSTGNFNFNNNQIFLRKSDGFVGIGTLTPNNKLDVVGGITATNTAGDGVTGYGGSSFGSGVVGQASYIGVYGSGGSYGLYGVGTGSTAYGVYGSGFLGVYATSNSESGDAFRGQAYGASEYGINAYSALSFGVYGNTGSSTSYAGYFVGNVFSSGSYQGSDRKLKQDIIDVTSAMDIIKKLQPKSYTYRQDGNYKLMNMPTGKHYGLIAQDVEQVLPDLVKATTFETGKAANPRKQEPGTTSAIPSATSTSETLAFKALNYTELIPIIIKSMQEQQQENDELKARIIKLENMVSKLTGQGNTLTGIGNLGQNSPNPVRNTTRISYNVPSGAGKAQLLVTDNLGKTLQVTQLDRSGNINLNTASLSSGIYNYSLVVDGKTVSTKKMTVVKN